MPDRMLDERAHAGAEHLDAGHVAGYERKAGYDPTEDIDVLLGHGLDGNALVLDMGPGTGVFATAVAPHCGRVIVADISPAVTAVLRQRIEARQLTNVEVVEAGFLSYQHEGPRLDVIFSRNALHQIPDFWKGIALQRLSSEQVSRFSTSNTSVAPTVPTPVVTRACSSAVVVERPIRQLVHMAFVVGHVAVVVDVLDEGNQRQT